MGRVTPRTAPGLHSELKETRQLPQPKNRNFTTRVKISKMAWLSAYNLIHIVLISHLLVGILLIYAPKTLTEQNIILLLGEAVGLVSSQALLENNV